MQAACSGRNGKQPASDVEQPHHQEKHSKTHRASKTPHDRSEIFIIIIIHLLRLRIAKLLVMPFKIDGKIHLEGVGPIGAHRRGELSAFP